MHPQKLIDTVIEFEKDLAAFYQKLENIDRLKELQKMGDVYSKLSHNFKNLADDEMQHHRHIQEELELYKKMERPSSAP